MVMMMMVVMVMVMMMVVVMMIIPPRRVMMMMVVVVVMVMMMVMMVIDQLHVGVFALVRRHSFCSSIRGIGHSQKRCGVWDRLEEFGIGFRTLNIT
jgi:hypothetical protein